GEIGFIEEVCEGRIYVRFGGHLVRVPLKSEDFPIDHAYAITTHKSQGSEWPVVIFMVDSSGGANWVGCRELVYTGISRIRTWGITIGKKRTIIRHCRVVSLRRRKTFLTEKIRLAMESLLVEMEDF